MLLSNTIFISKKEKLFSSINLHKRRYKKIKIEQTQMVFWGKFTKSRGVRRACRAFYTYFQKLKKEEILPGLCFVAGVKYHL